MRNFIIIKNLVNTKIILKKRPSETITEDLFQNINDEIDRKLFLIIFL